MRRWGNYHKRAKEPLIKKMLKRCNFHGLIVSASDSKNPTEIFFNVTNDDTTQNMIEGGGRIGMKVFIIRFDFKDDDSFEGIQRFHHEDVKISGYSQIPLDKRCIYEPEEEQKEEEGKEDVWNVKEAKPKKLKKVELTPEQIEKATGVKKEIDSMFGNVEHPKAVWLKGFWNSQTDNGAFVFFEPSNA